MEQAAAVRATPETHPPRRAHSELIYGIDEVPPLPQTLFAALQHMLAMFVAIITPPLIIANALGLPAADTRYIVSMSLVMSGIASFIQTRRFGPLGSGLLSVQGTSFNFLGPIIASGLALKQAAMPTEDLLGTLFGTMLAGYAVALLLGKVSPPTFEGPLVMVPIPLHYGIGFDWQLFVPLAIIFVVTALEAIGDMTATSDISGEPLDGPVYMARIKGGVLVDGANSMLAALFSTFPMSTFAQNNGVIQLTGVASRHVGLFIAAMLALLGLFPAVASLVQQIPEPVLGGATIVMFGTIAAAGVRIISREELDRRALMILAVSLAMGLGVAQVPEVLQHLPELARSVLSYGVATGGITAIVMNLLLPKRGGVQA